MGKFALMIKKEQEAEEKRKAQEVTYPTEQKVITPQAGAATAAPTIMWKQDGNVNFKSGSSKVDNQTIITAMESVYDEPDYVNISVSGGQKWKQMKDYEDNLSRDPGFKRLQEFMAKNHFSGTVEGIGAIPLMLGKDNSRYEPQNYWTSRQRNTFNYYYNEDPEKAKKYAEAVNGEYKSQNEEETKQWAVKHPFLATGAAFIMDRIAPAETQHNELTYARDGQLPYTTQVTPSRFSTIVRDAIEEDQDRRSGDPVSGNIYTAIDNAVNSAYFGYLQNVGGGLLGSAMNAVENYSGDYNNALYDALERGATEEEAINYARKNGKSAVWGGIVSDLLDYKLPETNGVKDSMIKEAISGVTGGMAEQYADAVIDYTTMGENSKYNQLVKAYMDAGYSRSRAEDKAWQRLGADGISNVMENLWGGLVYGYGRSDNSLKRAILKK